MTGLVIEGRREEKAKTWGERRKNESAKERKKRRLKV